MVDVVELVELSRKAAGTDPGLEPDDGLCAAVVALEEARAAIDAASLGMLAELDSRKATDTATGLGTGSWLARQAHESTGACLPWVRAARKVRDRLPLVADALAAGTISFDHVGVLVRACRPPIADEIAELQGELLDLARGMVFEEWRTQVDAIVDLLDADGTFDPNDDLNRNQLSISSTIDGLTKLDGTLTGADAIVVAELVNAKADELFRRFKVDHEKCPELEVPGRRTLMALALVELIRAGAAIDLASSRPPGTEASLIIPASDPTPEPTPCCPDHPNTDTDDPGRDDPHANADTGTDDPGRDDHPDRVGAHSHDPHRRLDLFGAGWGAHDPFKLGRSSKVARLLAGRPRVCTRHGVIVQDGTYRLLACDTVWYPIVVDNFGVALDMGRARRFATDAQRKAIALRDGGCAFPGCDRPVSWCDIHHVDLWNQGGETNLNRLVALCRHHHGVTHRNGWTLHATNDGWFTWTTPTGRILHSQRHHRQRAGPHTP